MKTIRVIDLLINYVRGQAIPSKIKIGDTIWTLENNNYVNKDLTPFYLDSRVYYFGGTYNLKVLNEEVEVIEK